MLRLLLRNLILTTTLYALVLAGTAAGNSGPVDCDRDPVLCAILKLRPNVDHKYAYKLSNEIAKYARKYSVDPYRIVAIGMQESGLRNIHRKHDVIVITEDCNEVGICTEYVKQVRGYTDIGIFQFHARTITDHGLDVLRLRDDIGYATEQACRLLSQKIRQCADLGDEAWSCYHSRTEKYRTKYVKLVERYYVRITK